MWLPTRGEQPARLTNLSGPPKYHMQLCRFCWNASSPTSAVEIRASSLWWIRKNRVEECDTKCEKRTMLCAKLSFIDSFFSAWHWKCCNFKLTKNFFAFDPQFIIARVQVSSILIRGSVLCYRILLRKRYTFYAEFSLQNSVCASYAVFTEKENTQLNLR